MGCFASVKRLAKKIVSEMTYSQGHTQEFVLGVGGHATERRSEGDRDAEGAEIETPKGREWGGGIPFISPAF